METRIQVVAIVATAILFFAVLELVRRRRLLERYALLWLVSALLLLALAVWKDLLETVASAIGVVYTPSALFVIAFGFTLALLLHFSIAVSKQADQTKVLAQRLALLEERQRELKALVKADDSSPESQAGEPDRVEPERQAPVLGRGSG